MTETDSADQRQAPRDTLLPCPFCGGDAVDRREIDGFPMIYCDGEECFGPQTTAKTFQDAVVQWNTRAALPSLPEAGEPVARAKLYDILRLFRDDNLSAAEAISAILAAAPPPAVSGGVQPDVREAVERCARIAHTFGIGRERSSYGGSDIAIRIRAEMRDFLSAVPPAPQLDVREWRCFHCGETFTDEQEARNHFGVDEEWQAGCVDPLTKDEKERRADQVQMYQELDRERDENSRLMSRDYVLGCWERDLVKFFNGAKSIHQAYLALDAMEGRALAAEEKLAALAAPPARSSGGPTVSDIEIGEIVEEHISRNPGWDETSVGQALRREFNIGRNSLRHSSDETAQHFREELTAEEFKQILPQTSDETEQWEEVTDGTTQEGDRFTYIDNPETGVGQVISHKRRVPLSSVETGDGK